MHTFEWKKTLVNKTAILHVPHEAARARRPEQDLRHADGLGGVKREAHRAVRHNAAHRRGTRRRALLVEPLEQVPEVGQAVLPRGLAEGGDVLGGVGVGGREAVRDGAEPEGREAVEGGGAAGPQEAVVVVLGVDEGDVEALAVEDLGQLIIGVTWPCAGNGTHTACGLSPAAIVSLVGRKGAERVINGVCYVQEFSAA